MTPFFDQEHEDFRATVRTFLEREAVPHHAQWEKDGQVSREVWRKAGEAGILCFDVDEEYGGLGLKDFRYNMVVAEEATRAGTSGLGFAVHTDIIVPYISQLGTAEQKRRWLPGLVSGELVSAIAMTEPGAGSDLQGIATTAVDKGDHYVLNGSKTFISNGILSDLVIVVCRTDPDAGHQGISLLVVERGMPGFDRGRNLEKVGAAFLAARLMAQELRDAGINVNCTPVLDVPERGAHEIIGDRAFSDDPDIVIALGRAVMDGTLAGGVLPVVKHVPGHGRAHADSHLALPRIDASPAELDATDFRPFRALADAPLAMTAHVLLTAFDDRRPASVSPVIMGEGDS